MGKNLVAYFSASGVTRAAARLVAQASGADVHEIVPAQPYTQADLDWTDEESRSSLEMADRSSRPEIAGEPVDAGSYDVVFLGFPIWWYREPSIIDTFLEQQDLADTTIVVFATSGSSGLGDTLAGLQDKVSPSALFEEGPVWHGVPSRAEVEAWVASR